MTIEERNELVLSDIPLANKIASNKNKSTPKNVTLDELRSAAYLGLIDAANKFKSDYSCSFSTYARFRIVGSIKDYLKKTKINFIELKDNYFSICDYDKLCFVDDLFSFLDYNGQNIMKMYYIENKSMKQIGEIFGVSESRISQMMNKYKKIIRNKIK